jgi:RNAse (barnase) inhibitor barstar
MPSLIEIIQSNDEKLRKREDALIQVMDEVYDSAIKNLIGKFKKLEKVSPDTKVSNQHVQKILDEVAEEFSGKFKALVDPVRKAMLDSYVEGLTETTEFLKQSIKEEK